MRKQQNKSILILFVPISAPEYDRKVVTMAINPQNKTFFWSDQNTATIYKLQFNSSHPEVVKEGIHGESGS